MKLNTYKNQKDIEKTFECESYDIMYGTIEDIFEIMDSINDNSTNSEIFNAIQKNRNKLNNLLFDIFPEMEKEDVKKIKLKDLVAFFMELFVYVANSFGNEKN